MKADPQQLMIDAIAPRPRTIATLGELVAVAVMSFGLGVLVMDVTTERHLQHWVDHGGDLVIAGYTIVCDLPITIDCAARRIGPAEIRP